MRVRVRFRVRGGHVVLRVFIGKPNGTFANCGTLTVGIGEEFEAMTRVMSGAEIVADEPQETEEL